MPPLSSRSYSAESLLESDLLSRKLLMVRKKRGGKKNEMISRQRDAEIKALGLLLRQLFLAVVTVNIEGRTSSACECYVCREHISRNDYRARAWGLRPSF